MRFSPAYSTTMIVLPLRMFYTHNVPADITWSDDPKESKIEIASINDYNKVVLQAKPRILVSRGQYNVSSTGLTDNLAEAKSLLETRGLEDKTNMIFIQGYSQIIIDARSEGLCERLADITSHFLAWTAPMLCNTLGFKSFATNMSVGPCTPGKEDTEIFSCTINVPWTKEEHWKVANSGADLKAFQIALSVQ